MNSTRRSGVGSSRVPTLVGALLAIVLVSIGAYNAGAGNDFLLWMIPGIGLATLVLVLDGPLPGVSASE